MADSLSKILSDSEKMTSLSRLMVLRREEALEEEKQLQPQIDLLRKRTHELQKQVNRLHVFMSVCMCNAIYTHVLRNSLA